MGDMWGALSAEPHRGGRRRDVNRKNFGCFAVACTASVAAHQDEPCKANHRRLSIFFVGQRCETEQPEVGTPSSRCCCGYCIWILPKLHMDVANVVLDGAMRRKGGREWSVSVMVQGVAL